MHPVGLFPVGTSGRSKQLVAGADLPDARALYTR